MSHSTKLTSYPEGAIDQVSLQLKGEVLSGASISGPMDVTDRYMRSIQVNCSAADVVMTIEVSHDGVNWTTYNRVITNDIGGTIVSTITVTANTTMWFFPLDQVHLVRFNVTAGTDYQIILSAY